MTPEPCQVSHSSCEYYWKDLVDKGSRDKSERNDLDTNGGTWYFYTSREENQAKSGLVPREWIHTNGLAPFNLVSLFFLCLFFWYMLPLFDFQSSSSYSKLCADLVKKSVLALRIIQQ